MATYLTRTVSDATSNRLATFSFWVKRSNLTDQDGQGSNYLFCVAGPGGFSDSDWLGLQFRGVDTLRLTSWYGGINVTTNKVFRDPASWYHIVVRIDTTAGAAANRVRMYINGTEQTSFGNSSYPSQDYDFNCLGDSGAKHYVGCAVSGSIGSPSPYDYTNGYIADFNFTSGQSYPASSFAETDSTTGEWKPKSDLSALTYGDNGFRLKFENAGSLGADSSGQGHNLTVSGAGTNAQTTDTPSNNFAVFNPLIAYLNAGSNSTRPTFSEGNLKTVTTNSGKLGGSSTLLMTKGKWYAEFKFVESNNAGSTIESVIGVTDSPQRLAAQFGKPGERANDVAYAQTGNKLIGDSATSFGATYTDGDIIGVAVDLDNNAIYFSKNGVFQNSGVPTSGSTKTGAIALTDPASTVEGGYYFAVGEASSETSTHQANFGNPPFTISSGNTDSAGLGNFEYAVPSGYYALCTKNLNTVG